MATKFDRFLDFFLNHEAFQNLQVTLENIPRISILKDYHNIDFVKHDFRGFANRAIVPIDDYDDDIKKVLEYYVNDELLRKYVKSFGKVTDQYIQTMTTENLVQHVLTAFLEYDKQIDFSVVGIEVILFLKWFVNHDVFKDVEFVRENVIFLKKLKNSTLVELKEEYLKHTIRWISKYFKEDEDNGVFSHLLKHVKESMLFEYIPPTKRGDLTKRSNKRVLLEAVSNAYREERMKKKAEAEREKKRQSEQKQLERKMRQESETERKRQQQELMRQEAETERKRQQQQQELMPQEFDSDTESDTDADDENIDDMMQDQRRIKEINEQKRGRSRFDRLQTDDDILDYTTEYMEFLREGDWSLSCDRIPGEDMKLHPVQLVNTTLTSPRLPFHKLLLVAPTGIGKTIMIAVTLNQYFEDSRPKIVLSPQGDQYYNELFMLPDNIGNVLNRYKIFTRAVWARRNKSEEFEEFLRLIKLQKQGKVDSKQNKKIKRIRSDIKLLLEFKQKTKSGSVGSMIHNGALKSNILELFTTLGVRYPTAPFRIIQLQKNKRVQCDENMAMFKFPVFYIEHVNQEKSTIELSNIYERNIFIIDEFHNLYSDRKSNTWPHKDFIKILMKQQNSRVFGYTATPIIDNVSSDFNFAMKIIKGEQYSDHADSHTGFYTYYNSFPTSVFPSIDVGNPMLPENVLQMVRYVCIKDQSMYFYNENKQREEKSDENASISHFLNFGTHLKRFGTRSLLYKALVKLVDMEQTDDQNIKMQVLSYWSSKFYQIIQDIKTIESRKGKRHKILVLGFDNQHLRAFAFILKAIGYKVHTNSTKNWAKDVFQKHNAELQPEDENNRVMFLHERSSIHKVLNAQNNVRGEKFRIILANLKYYNESVDFFHIRHMMLLNPPPNGLEYSQYIGRAIRFCSHSDLPESSRTLGVHIYCGVQPNVDEETYGITSDQRDLKRLTNSLRNLNTSIDDLKQSALDYTVLSGLS